MQALPVLSNAGLIATHERPLRASAIPKFLLCPGAILLSDQFWGQAAEGDDDSGEAAQTGSLVHHAAENFHRGGDGFSAIPTFQGQYPLANPDRARKIFTAYAEDPRNQGIKLIKLEEKIALEIPPDPSDPTGLPVVVRGTLDQVRDDGTVWDIKTGKTYYGSLALDHYYAQQVIYTVASGHQPGGLICTDGYFRPGKRVFFRYTQTLDEMKQLLPVIAWHVAQARRKQITRTPGDHCKYCPHKNVENCSEYVRHHVL